MSDGGPAGEMIAALARHHGAVDARALLSPFVDVLVRVPAAGRPLHEPYIPFVGPDYEPGGLLLLSTAQNLAQFGKSGDTANWRLSTGLPDAALFRLYRLADRTIPQALQREEVSFRAIAMQPCEDGILPALAGLWMAARGEAAPQSLDEVTARIAITNFYKHSLRTERGADLNPGEESFRERLPAYREMTLRAFAGPEVEILRPGGILAFRGIPEVLLSFAPPGCRWSSVRDPSWVKQGMGGYASAATEKRKAGPWFRIEEDRRISPKVRELVEAYLEQLGPPYSKGKQTATRRYLLGHFVEFLA